MESIRQNELGWFCEYVCGCKAPNALGQKIDEYFMTFDGFKFNNDINKVIPMVSEAIAKMNAEYPRCKQAHVEVWTPGKETDEYKTFFIKAVPYLVGQLKMLAVREMINL